MIVESFPCPSGGAITLSIQEASGNLTVTRAPDNITVYEGAPILKLLDFRLNPSTAYTYTLTDSISSFTTPAITPSNILTYGYADLTDIIINIMQSSFSTNPLPVNIPRPTVMRAMPISGFPNLPIIAIFEQMIAQSQVPIGQQTGVLTDLQNSTSMIVERKFLISVMSKNSSERDILRGIIISILFSSLAPIFSQIGQNISHNFLVEAGQMTDIRENRDSMVPGFYWSDILFSVEGMFNIGVANDYGLIQDIYIKGYQDSSLVIDVHAPD